MVSAFALWGHVDAGNLQETVANLLILCLRGVENVERALTQPGEESGKASWGR